jgi:hypothetical protein
MEIYWWFVVLLAGITGLQGQRDYLLLAAAIAAIRSIPVIRWTLWRVNEKGGIVKG